MDNILWRWLWRHPQTDGCKWNVLICINCTFPDSFQNLLLYTSVRPHNEISFNLLRITQNETREWARPGRESKQFYHVHCALRTVQTAIWSRCNTIGLVDFQHVAWKWHFQFHLQRRSLGLNCTKIVVRRGSAADPSGELIPSCLGMGQSPTSSVPRFSSFALAPRAAHTFRHLHDNSRWSVATMLWTERDLAWESINRDIVLIADC